MSEGKVLVIDDDEHVRTIVKSEAITSELAQTGQPAPRSDPKAAEAFVRGVEERLAHVPSSAQ
jgi:hypothetical protein